MSVYRTRGGGTKVVIMEPGDRYNYLTILSPAPKSASKSAGQEWLVRCDCGNEVQVLGKDIRKTNQPKQTCGKKGCPVRQAILRERLWNPKKVADGSKSRSVYNLYKNQSPGRGVLFNLTEEEFERLILAICFYCEKPPSIKTNLSLTRNGIDRVDNKRGYELDNCVTCCFKCNKMKGSLSIDSFLSQVDKIQQTSLKRIKRD